jgi:hypothetical protein
MAKQPSEKGAGLTARIARTLTRRSTGRQLAWRWVFLLFSVVAALVLATVAFTPPNAEPGRVAAGFIRGAGHLSGVWKPGNLGHNGQTIALAEMLWKILPFAGVVVGFWNTVIGAIARMLLGRARGHVVVVGDCDAARALARSIASDRRHVAVLACPAGMPADAIALRMMGINAVVVDPADPARLASIGAHRATHVVMMAKESIDNLQAVAALQEAVRAKPEPVAPGKQSHSAPTVHVRLEDPIVLQETRNLDGFITRGGIETRPFSLSEIAARRLLRDHDLMAAAPPVSGVGFDWLNGELVPQGGAPHVVIVGDSPLATEVAIAALRTLWSVRRKDPIVTLLVPDADAAEARFKALYPHAMAHAVLRAQVDFRSFSWPADSRDWQAIADPQVARPACAVVIAMQNDHDSLACALSLSRARRQEPSILSEIVPIFLAERHRNRFSAELGADVGDIRPFGAVEATATMDEVVRALLDRGAAEAHRIYQRDVNQTALDKAVVAAMRDTVPAAALERMTDDLPIERQRRMAIEATEMPPREVTRMVKQIERNVQERPPQGVDFSVVTLDWRVLGENFRRANRANADHAVVKLADLGWRAAGRRTAAGDDASPSAGPASLAAAPPSDALLDAMSAREHDRWVMERLLSGWRPPAAEDIRAAVEAWRAGDPTRAEIEPDVTTLSDIRRPLRDNKRRIHPDITPFATLTPEAQRKDRAQVLGAYDLAPHVWPAGFIRV